MAQSSTSNAHLREELADGDRCGRPASTGAAAWRETYQGGSAEAERLAFERMAADQLTMYFAAGGLGKAESAERLTFKSKESAEAALAEYETSSNKDTSKVFRVKNEAGESIVFQGAHLRRYTVKKALALD